jgi:hypothetical protein
MEYTVFVCKLEKFACKLWSANSAFHSNSVVHVFFWILKIVVEGKIIRAAILETVFGGIPQKNLSVGNMNDAAYHLFYRYSRTY